MLPGFRFLLAAILLSMSLMVFGLGAGALVRTAHEEFAANPTWRAPPETRFAEASEPAKPPVLAMLRVDLPTAEQPHPSADAATSTPVKPEAAVPSRALDSEPVTTVALAAEEDAVKPEIPTAVTAPAASDSPAALLPVADAPTTAPVADAPSAPTDHLADKPAITESKVAAPETIVLAAPVNAPASVTPESASNAPAPAPATTPEQPEPPSATNIDPATFRIATLGGPPVATDSPALTPDTKTDTKADLAKRRLHAQRVRARRLAAYRARMARQQTLQQAIGDPFGQQRPPLPLPFGTR